MAKHKVEYVRLPLPPEYKAELQRAADLERRTLGQMAAIIVIDRLPKPSENGAHPGSAWRTPNLIPPDG